LAFCGLYCGDCAGHTGAVADAAEELKKVIAEYKFERTASDIFFKELTEYDKFAEMLDFISGLHCSPPCRDKAKGDTDCKIRECCIERGYFACNECAEFADCDKLAVLAGYFACNECTEFADCYKLAVLAKMHSDSCVRNLTAINEMGIEEWLENGKRYWFGDE
jgi:hypothetical protein